MFMLYKRVFQRRYLFEHSTLPYKQYKKCWSKVDSALSNIGYPMSVILSSGIVQSQ